MSELRTAPRHKTLKGGKIAFSALSASIDCVVRNLSDTGACLIVESPLGVPNRFDLVVNGERDARKCTVAWRSDKKIGVAFNV